VSDLFGRVYRLRILDGFVDDLGRIILDESEAVKLI
jgi:hypothetical protein